MRRATIGAAGAGVLLLLVLLGSGWTVRPGVEAAAVAEDGGAEATATRAAEEAELADLRTRVAELSTEVAGLGGNDEEALAGRLGGSRAGFDDAYGAPTAFFGDDQVTYAVPDVGRLFATFEDGRAVRLMVSPERPEEKPTSEPDAADWTLERAQEIVDRFAPLDAALAEPQRARPAEGRQAAGESPALAEGAATPEVSDCPAADGGTFTVSYTTPTRQTVSAVTLELIGDGAAPVPDEPLTRLAGDGGGITRARSSLPSGVTNVNGVAVQGVQARLDEDGTGPAPAGSGYAAVELTIENRTDEDLAYEPEHFVLTDEEGRELAAVCGGVEPAITSGVLAPGEAVEGWVSFLVPEGFEPDQITYLVNGSNGTLIIFTIR